MLQIIFFSPSRYLCEGVVPANGSCAQGEPCDLNVSWLVLRLPFVIVPTLGIWCGWDFLFLCHCFVVLRFNIVFLLPPKPWGKGIRWPRLYCLIPLCSLLNFQVIFFLCPGVYLVNLNFILPVVCEHYSILFQSLI